MPPRTQDASTWETPCSSHRGGPPRPPPPSPSSCCCCSEQDRRAPRCPINDPDCGGPGDTTATWTNTLTVTKPAGATVTSTGGTDGITCGSDCTARSTLDKSVSETVGSVPAFTNTATVPVSIATDPDASLTCSTSGAMTVASAPCSGTYSPVSASSPDGSYTYSITATDAVANVAVQTRTFTLDRTAPVVASFDGPPEGGSVSTSSVTQKRTFHAGAVLTIQVTKRGMTTKTVRITMRKRARPKVR
jgi:hypothetical protein